MGRLSVLLGVVKGLLLFQLARGTSVSPGNETSLIASHSRIKQDVAVVASLDGNLHLVNTNTKDVKWSFYSGQRIYSSYQSAENASEPDSGEFYYLDCGDDWELYLHSKRSGKLQKLGLTAEEYLRRLPHVWYNGQITLGQKKTKAFVVDAHNGTMISSFNSDANPSGLELQGSKNPILLVVGSDADSSKVWDETRDVIFFTRTDYVLRHYAPNSSDVLWSVSFAEIEAEFRCPTIRSTLNSGEKSDQWNFPCHLKTTVLRVRDHERLDFDKLLLNQFGYSTKHLLGFDHASLLPALPYTKEPSFEAPANNMLALPSSSLQNIPMIEGSTDKASSSHSIFNHVGLKSIILSTMVASASVVSFFWYIFAFRRQTQVKLDVSPKESKSPPKKKKVRKGGNNAFESTKKQGNGFINNGLEEDYDRINIDGRKLQFSFHKLGDEMANGRRIGKLVVSTKEIAKGSNGTVVLEGVYDGREVAVKRLVDSHHEIARKEIENLYASDHHQNIVRLYGIENDQDFIYIALERCSCSLNDFIYAHSEFHQRPAFEGDSSREKGTKFHLLWKPNGYPSPLLLNLMRDIVKGLEHLHNVGMIHRDLKPQNVLILNEKTLSAKLSDMGISKRLNDNVSTFTQNGTGCGSSGWQAPEQLLQQRQTRAVDLFALGCVLFFCVTGGKHPFGDPLERDINIVNNKKDLFLVEHIPEVFDLLSQLLDPDPQSRPKASDVLKHPLFWSSNDRLSFLQDASDRVELEDREDESELLDALEKSGTASLNGKWDEKLEPIFLNNIGRYRRYRFDSVRDLLRVIRNKSHHYRELPEEVKSLLGPHPVGFEAYFSKRFPKLLIEVYKVFRRYCDGEEFFLRHTKAGHN